MKKYQKIFIGLSLLTFISCGSSGGGGHDKPSNISTTSTQAKTQSKEEVKESEASTKPKESIKPINNKEVTQKGETLTIPISAEDGETKISNGNVNINDKTKVAMSASDGAKFTNGKDGTISGTFAIGMESNGADSKVTNNGEITGRTDENSFSPAPPINNEETPKKLSMGISTVGMKTSSGGKAVNNGKIHGELSVGIESDGENSSAINRGKISLTGTSYKEHTVEYEHDNGNTDTYTYDDNGLKASGMKATNGGYVKNEKTGTLDGNLTIGIKVDGQGSSGVNSGVISSSGSIQNGREVMNKSSDIDYSYEISAIGMDVNNGGKAINDNSGVIKGNIAVGMQAYDEGSEVTNNGTISSEGYYSIYQDTQISEEQKLNIRSTELSYGTGMEATNGAKAINGKNGVIEGKFDFGMVVEDGGSTAINYGKIISFDHETLNLTEVGPEYNHTYIGMLAYPGTTVTNNGTIEINADNSTGIYVDGHSKNSTGINGPQGKIYLNANNGIGMEGSGEHATIKNFGTIYLSGSKVTPSRGSQTAEEIATSSEMINGKDSKGNIGMKIEDGAKMINKGRIVFGK